MIIGSSVAITLIIAIALKNVDAVNYRTFKSGGAEYSVNRFSNCLYLRSSEEQVVFGESMFRSGCYTTDEKRLRAEFPLKYINLDTDKLLHDGTIEIYNFSSCRIFSIHIYYSIQDDVRTAIDNVDIPPFSKTSNKSKPVAFFTAPIEPTDYLKTDQGYSITDQGQSISRSAQVFYKLSC